MQATLLVELLTEELPPKSLQRLSQAFCDALVEGLRQDNLLARKSAATAYATPRRLAVRISDVLEQAPDQPVEISGPSVKVGLDADGTPTPALKGFARKNGVVVDELVQIDTPKGKIFACRKVASGVRLETNLGLRVEDALKRLPVPKMMRWGSGEAEFVRPVHGLVMMHGSHVVRGEVWDLKSTNQTFGHRFLSAKPIKLKHADDYENALREKGKVEASFAARRARIKGELQRAENELAKQIARKPNARIPIHDQRIIIDTERTDPPAHFFTQTSDYERALACGGGTALLDEVTALVEWPRAYWGHFDEQFLEIPVECLALTMKHNQKYFPVFDTAAKLLPYFVVIGNNDDSLATEQPRQIHQNIVSGNERVLRPRLADARFFFEQDRKVRLEKRVPLLAKVVYHNKLGTQIDRTERIQLLAGSLARMLDADVVLAERAAWLAKADLLTAMVGEFPELQGIMGRYYALHDAEPETVANAIEAHYRPRFAGDGLPKGRVACALALADKLEALAGMFSIGEQPTGDRDPFALRRHALGVVRILVENSFALSLRDLVNNAFGVFPKGIGPNARTELMDFIQERLRGYLRDGGYTANEVESVLCQGPERLDQLPRQLAAVRAFAGLPEAESLAAANKRVANILKQAEAKGESFHEVEIGPLKEPAECDLFEALKTASQRAAPLFEQGDYTGYLKTFAILKSPVDAFFDSVMVMVDDAALRQNRLALLAQLRKEMNRVADLSKLAT